MGTIVTIELSRPLNEDAGDGYAAIERAFEWFLEVERVCNRFDPTSELRTITATPGRPVQASELLFAALDFAMAIAHDTNGAFDPTVGARMEARGFNRDYRSGAAIDPTGVAHASVSYRDVDLDPAHRTVTITQPLILDLGALAKGLAIDLAARELSPFRNFVVDAGGDLYLAGCNAAGAPWSVGIRHPRIDREAIERLTVSDAAVCTSGDYERVSADGGHILDPSSGSPASRTASATVIAPTAMLADALATAAFVLDPADGIRLLQRHGVNGIIYTPELDRFATHGIEEFSRHG